MIRILKDQGFSISEIARGLGISRTTVRRYLKSGKVPQYHRDPAGSMIEPYLPLVREMIDQHNLSAVRIYEELREKFFKGSYSLVKQYSRPMRNDRKTWQSTGTKQIQENNRRWISGSSVTSKPTGKEGNCMLSA